MFQQDGSRLLRGRQAELHQVQQHILSMQVGAIPSTRSVYSSSSLDALLEHAAAAAHRIWLMQAKDIPNALRNCIYALVANKSSTHMPAAWYNSWLCVFALHTDQVAKVLQSVVLHQ